MMFRFLVTGDPSYRWDTDALGCYTPGEHTKSGDFSDPDSVAFFQLFVPYLKGGTITLLASDSEFDSLMA